MKLTKREKILLILLASFLILYLLYRFVFSVQLNTISSLKARAQDYQKKVDSLEHKLGTKGALQERYKFANAKVFSIINAYVPEIIQEKLILSINEMIEESGVNIEGIDYSEIKIDDINSKGNESAAVKEETLLDELKKQYGLLDEKEKTDKGDKKEDSLKAVSMKVNIQFYSDYEQALYFLKLLESYEKRIVIESFSLDRAVSELGGIRGNTSIVIYTLPQMDNSLAEKYNSWNIQNTYGKDNPFVPFNGYTGPIGAVTGTPKAYIDTIKYDFTLAVSPIMSDMPTVFMGQNNGGSSSQVYADNKGFENVELQLKGEKGKYYFKYKTGKLSYPKNYSNEWVEFTPASKGINFIIVSTPRTGTNDKTGASLSVTNKTDLPLNVFIKNDDKVSSRIKITKQEGNIYYTK